MNRILRDALIQLITALMLTQPEDIVIRLEAKRFGEKRGQANLTISIDGNEMPPLTAEGAGVRSALANLMMAFMSFTSRDTEGPLH